MNAHEYMRKFMLESVDIYAFNYSNAYEFLERLHVLDYIHSRLTEVDRSLLPKVEDILRKLFSVARDKIKEMYGFKLANFFRTRTPEDDKRKAVSTFLSEFIERDKLMNYWKHIFYDEANDQLLFGVNGLPLDKKYFRSMDGFTFRDVAVCLMRVKDFRREDEMERECEDKGFSLNSWRISRLEDIDYAVRKQMENASWADIGHYLIAGREDHREVKMEGGLVSMYGEILEWSPQNTPIREQRVLMTRALQHAHHTEPVMATKIGLSEQDLENLNNIDVLPSPDHEQRERRYNYLGRGDRNEGERTWLLQLAAKHGVSL